ncbi:hypothetical protein AZI86_00425 [Bdellovibrio bacteriovorus]|uniref:Restriction endonuclease n=1 Tax=Bdellovibrio bacteriovorus TaxID=959 RepID=A0A150WME1_BDEBC|nr:hypothetical protein [Bdellovibrio bacteriovorus]KYG65580.1 hypothetical protein AZI86_00425 [Bdellovibrio bacteriovorus]
MNPKLYTFYEYSGFISKFDGRISTSLSEISNHHSFPKAMEKLSTAIVPNESIFSVSPTSIKAKNYVGVVVSRDIQFEILPKLISNGEGDSHIRNNLIHMLSVCHDFKYHKSALALLEKDIGNFLEFFIKIFADDLLSLLLFERPLGYSSVEENLPFIRGKILFKEDRKRNLVNKSRVYCRFDEVNQDTPLNQLFLFVANFLKDITRSSDSYRNLNKVIKLLPDVSERTFDRSSVEAVVLPNHQRAFQEVFELAKMFVQRSVCTFRQKSTEMFSFVFDMNDLFEEYIYKVIVANKKALGLDNVIYQKHKKLVSHERDLLSENGFIRKSGFSTFSDIYLETKGGRRFILDTKYKILTNSKAHYGIRNSDVYQILAYTKIHSESSKIIPILLYPQEGFEVSKMFRISGSDESVLVKTINLHLDLRTDENALVDSIRSVIDCP